MTHSSPTGRVSDLHARTRPPSCRGRTRRQPTWDSTPRISAALPLHVTQPVPLHNAPAARLPPQARPPSKPPPRNAAEHPSRSEEHTSDLQSLMLISYAFFCLKSKKLSNTTN